MTGELTPTAMLAALAVATVLLSLAAFVDRWERRRPLRVGSRVRITVEPWHGETGRVADVDGSYAVKVDTFEYPMWFDASERIGWLR